MALAFFSNKSFFLGEFVQHHKRQGGLSNPTSTNQRYYRVAVVRQRPRSNTLQEIYDPIGSRNTIGVVFSTATKLRNTTGHNLVWDDLFSDSQKYNDLFRQVANAIPYVITTKA